MPGKGKGGKGKGKGYAQAPPAPAPPARWTEQADDALLNIIFRIGEFRISNWDDVYHEFQEAGYLNTRNSCQTRWSRTLRGQYQDYVRHVATQPNGVPQHPPVVIEGPHVYPPPENSPPTSPIDGGNGNIGSQPRTPQRLPIVPEEPAADSENFFTGLYDKYGRCVGKIEAKNGFRIYEIKNTLQMCLPMVLPVSSWPLKTNDVSPQPDVSVIDPQLDTPDLNRFNSFGADGSPSHRKSRLSDMDEYINWEAYDAHGNENQPE
ncbi:hypothetical protein PG996_004225 [Apiospora saccharicola]|uniref:Myb-like domain-containing protein n=1 Tax=Apiospora saccharicola TaxID=335842 RepID=A0ABR1W3I9_9PEZI